MNRRHADFQSLLMALIILRNMLRETADIPGTGRESCEDDMIDWNPDMSAAPRDGTPFLVWGGHWAGEVNGAEAYYYPLTVQTTNGLEFDVVGTDAYAAWVVNPTHWMALPATP